MIETERSLGPNQTELVFTVKKISIYIYKTNAWNIWNL